MTIAGPAGLWEEELFLAKLLVKDFSLLSKSLLEQGIEFLYSEEKIITPPGLVLRSVLVIGITIVSPLTILPTIICVIQGL